MELKHHYLQVKRKSDWLKKDQLSANITTRFVEVRPETYCYLINDHIEEKKAEGTKSCIIKPRLENYRKYVENSESILRSQQRFQSESHNVFTETFSNIAFGFVNHNRLQSFSSKIISVWKTCWKNM